MGVVEFALVLPLLLIPILIGGFEVGRMVKAKEAMSSLGRETANEAFRTCTQVLDATEAKNCVSKVATDFNEYFKKEFGKDQEFAIVVSMYVQQDGALLIDRYSSFSTDVKVCGSDIKPKWRSGSDIPSDSNVMAMLNRDGVTTVTMSEVFFCYKPFVSFIPGWSERQLYEPTIY